MGPSTSGTSPRSRLVAFLAHRGFATGEVARVHVDGATLAATKYADEKGTATVVEFPIRRRRRNLAIALAMAAVAAAGVGLAPW